jgi:hypothetical protein
MFCTHFHLPLPSIDRFVASLFAGNVSYLDSFPAETLYPNLFIKVLKRLWDACVGCLYEVALPQKVSYSRLYIYIGSSCFWPCPTSPTAAYYTYHAILMFGGVLG